MSSKGPTCPICGDATAAQFRPFCSRRCADVDLARWLRGVYTIPVVDADDDEDGVGPAAEHPAEVGRATNRTSGRDRG